MSKRLKSILQVAFSLALGFFLIWFFIKDLSAEDKQNIAESFANANYFWVAIAIAIAILSHVFRAYRWRYTLEPLGIKIDFANRFAAVMIGYLANLAFPRLGEVSRCAILARYKKQPFEKLFGTVVAERLVDVLILLFVICLTLILQLEILGGFIMSWLEPKLDDWQSKAILGGVGLLGLSAAYIGWRFLQLSNHKMALFVRDKVMGLVEGIKSLQKMERKFEFYLHTALIWLSYITMHWIAFLAFPETSEVPFGGILASFTMGGLTIVAVQGGLGAYPLGVMSVLLLYGIDRDLGYAFGWISWVAQTVMILVVGFISVLIMPLINAKPEKDAS
ncbi:MAG: flippase-like domain-containing protein [Flavobacteriales bacterium]|nr:flippase-like domain-containing protein [Flavobacteriales bacterium]